MSDRDSFFQDLCDNATDLIQSVSPEGRFLYVNKAWLSTLGYAREEVPALTLHDIIHSDSREHCERMMQELIEVGKVVQVEAAFVAKDGRRVLVEGSASCRFENGQPVSTRGIFRDVSRRRRAQQEIDRFFDLSLDLLCIAGVDGYFKRINPAFESVLGYSRDEMLSRSFIDFVHPDDRESTLTEVQRLAQGQPVVDFRNRYRAKDGSYRWLAWRSAPLADWGLIYAVARDVTERKRVEELMARQARELARSNEDLEQFAYVASHDLRAPLRTIVTLTEWIEEDMAGELPGKVKGHLNELRRRVRRMETLTDDLLAYSRAGRETGSIETVDTASLVADLTDLLSPPPGFKILADSSLPSVRTFPAALEQVFRNLIGNAIKHHDRVTGRVEVSARDMGDYVEFSVTDDGPGIPAEYQDRIFQMFQRLKPKDEVEGTGLGLALVKRLVEGLGGRLRVESNGTRGAVFRFTWPRDTAETEEDHADPADRR